MATISSPGIGSGLDINSIVSQLVAVEKAPLKKLQTEASSLQSKLSIYGQVKSALSSLRDASNALGKSETWGQSSVTNSDPSSVAVTASANTLPGSYSLQVQSLAAAQLNASKIYESPNSLVGEGSLVIETGTWSNNQSNFTSKTSITISVGPPAESLAQLRDKINAAKAGVVASVLTDAGGSRLVFKSSATGVENGFRIKVTDADTNHSDALGLSALAYDPSAGILTMAQAIAAANAAATLNGLSLSSSTNTMNNVVDGLTLTLGKVTTTPVNITTARDSAGIRKSLDDFVKAYNSLNSLLADQTKYDAASKKSGALQGDNAALSIRAQMRNLLATESTASSTFSRLSEIGFDVQRDGSIKVNDTKLSAAMSNLSELQKVLGNIDIAGSAKEGIATRIRRLVDQMNGFNGTVANRTDGLKKLIDANSDKQSDLNDRAAAYEKRLRQQYTSLDAKMSTLNGLQSYVTQQFTPRSNS